MEIKTKYSIGDAVYILDNYKIVRVNVFGIDVNVCGPHINVTYSFAVFPRKKQKECFATKEELINYLSK